MKTPDQLRDQWDRVRTRTLARVLRIENKTGTPFGQTPAFSWGTVVIRQEWVNLRRRRRRLDRTFVLLYAQAVRPPAPRFDPVLVWEDDGGRPA